MARTARHLWQRNIVRCRLGWVWMASSPEQHCLSVPSRHILAWWLLPALCGNVRSSQQREDMCDAIIINMSFNHYLCECYTMSLCGAILILILASWSLHASFMVWESQSKHVLNFCIKGICEHDKTQFIIFFFSYFCHNNRKAYPTAQFGWVTYMFVCIIHKKVWSFLTSHHGALPWIAGDCSVCEVLQIFLAHVWCHNVCVPYFWHIFGVTICELVCVTRCPTMALWTAHMSWSRTASSDDRCNVNILPPEHSHAYIPASRSLFFVFHPESGSLNITSSTWFAFY